MNTALKRPRKFGRYNPDRARPSAMLNGGNPAQISWRNRGVILSTGRGDTTVTPEEAEALAAELLAAARAHRERVAAGTWVSCRRSA